MELDTIQFTGECQFPEDIKKVQSKNIIINCNNNSNIELIVESYKQYKNNRFKVGFISNEGIIIEYRIFNGVNFKKFTLKGVSLKRVTFNNCIFSVPNLIHIESSLKNINDIKDICKISPNPFRSGISGLEYNLTSDLVNFLINKNISYSRFKSNGYILKNMIISHDITKCDFSNCQFENLVIQGTRRNKIRISNCQFINTIFTGEKTRFENCIFTLCDFKNELLMSPDTTITFINCIFRRTNLNGRNWNKSQFEICIFSSGGKFLGGGNDFQHCDLSQVKFDSCIFILH